MKRKKKIFLGVAVLAALAVAALAFAGGGQEVETARVERGGISRTVEDSGYVQPATDYGIHATQSARVAQVPVEAGQAVKQGQTLVVLENLDLSLHLSEVRSQLSQAATSVSGARAALERVRLELDDARENLKRVEELYQAGAVSRAEYDKALLQVESYEQNLQETNSRLDSALAQETGLYQSLRQLVAKERQLTVKSPVDGTVLDVPVKKEQVLLPGALMVSVAVPGQLEVKADILSDDLAEVKAGQKAVITAPVLGQTKLTGQVQKIYPRAEEKQSALGIVQRRVPVIISLPETANLKPGYEVKVAIETRTSGDVLVLPREAVRTARDGRKEVMVVVNGRVQQRTVQTGLGDRRNIEITAGLAEGDLVVRDGGLALADKTKIKLI